MARRPGVLDTDPRCGLGWQLSQALITVGRPGADGATGAPRRGGRVCDIGPGAGVVVASQTDRVRA